MMRENKDIPSIIDIGANLTNTRFAKDLDAVVARAKNNGVSRIVITGTSEQGSQSALKLASQMPEFTSSTAGIHPHEAKTWCHDVERVIGDLIRHEGVVAVGECGLDFDRDFSPRPAQELCFEAQLALAASEGKPVFLHEREAHKRFYSILKHFRDDLTGCVVHCFTGSKEELYRYLDLDCYIGITGWICDERRGLELRKLTEEIPASRLMIETDAPYLTPRDIKPKPTGGRNEPAFLKHIALCIAEIRGVTYKELAETTSGNAQRFFGL